MERIFHFGGLISTRHCSELQKGRGGGGVGGGGVVREG